MKLSNILLIIADILCLFQLVEADESILYKDLIKDYNKEIRPKKNNKEAVKVTLDFELRQIIDLNEKDEILTFAGFFIARWKDDRMVWDPAVHGDIQSMVIPPDVIWLPDMGIENRVRYADPSTDVTMVTSCWSVRNKGADSFYHHTFRRDFHVRLYYNGSVQWAFGGQINTLCDLDVTYYPFDLQKCTIEVENWVYHGHEVELRNKSDVIETGAYLPHGLWDLVRTKSEQHEDKYFWATGPEPHLEVKFTLYLKRKSRFYVVNLVLPCILIILVALGVFWLPAESGEKVSLAVTLLLAFSVFQIVLADSMPANSDYYPVLAQLVTATMTLSAISVLTSIIILYLHFKDPEMPVPQCLRCFFFRSLLHDKFDLGLLKLSKTSASLRSWTTSATLCLMFHAAMYTGIKLLKNITSSCMLLYAFCLIKRYLATVVCLRGSAPEVMSDQVAPSDEGSIRMEDIENAKGSSDLDIVRISQNLAFIANKMKETQRDEKIVKEWRFLALVLDRILFWISAVISLIILLVFLVPKDRNY